MFHKSARLFLLVTLLSLFAVNTPHLSAQPPASLTHTTPYDQPSIGRVPTAARTTSSSRDELSSGDALLSRDVLQSPLATIGKAAFALEYFPDDRARYIPDADTPGEWIYVGNVEGSAYYAGDFVGRNYNKVYVLDYYQNELHTVNTATGITSTIGTSPPLLGHMWTGATGTADGILYASSSDLSISYLYTVNTSTGTVTTVGKITNSDIIIDIAINANGVMYGVDIFNDNLVRINRTTGAGTVIGPIGFDAHLAQGMDFEEGSGKLYMAAYNNTLSRGELRTVNRSTGSTTLVGVFPDDAEVTVLAFTPPPTQRLQNPGFESGWAYWNAHSGPILSSTSHSGSSSVTLFGEECWVYQPVTIPGDALEVTIGYWITGTSSDDEWDNDILCGSIWDLTWQIEYVDACFGMTYFKTSPPSTWKHRIYRLEADELSAIAGKTVQVAFYLTQDWNPPHHQISIANVDDTALYVTRPMYDHMVYLPMAVR